MKVFLNVTWIFKSEKVAMTITLLTSPDVTDA